MKILVSILFLIQTILSFSQNNDKMIFFNVINDTVLFYLDDKGDITTKSNAKFYRKCQLDKRAFNYNGKVEDYYIDGQKAYECYYYKGFLNGEVKSFYKNGQIHYQGVFQNSLKNYIWTFYYENGKKEKLVRYNSDTSYLMEYYKENGDNVFLNGNGKYKGTIIAGYKQTTESHISGTIKNGKFDGKWKWYGDGASSSEYFENGKFIKNDLFMFKDESKISLTGFDLHENVDIYKFSARQNSGDRNHIYSQMLKYNKSNKLDSTFTPEIKKHLVEFGKNNNISHYWCFIQFTVNKSNGVEFSTVYSNNNLISDDLKRYISNLSGFQAANPNEKSVDCVIYLSMFCENGIINIPEYDFFNTGYDIMKLIPNQ